MLERKCYSIDPRGKEGETDQSKRDTHNKNIRYYHIDSRCAKWSTGPATSQVSPSRSHAEIPEGMYPVVKLVYRRPTAIGSRIESLTTLQAATNAAGNQIEGSCNGILDSQNGNHDLSPCRCMSSMSCYNDRPVAVRIWYVRICVPCIACIPRSRPCSMPCLSM